MRRTGTWVMVLCLALGLCLAGTLAWAQQAKPADKAAPAKAEEKKEREVVCPQGGISADGFLANYNKQHKKLESEYENWKEKKGRGLVEYVMAHSNLMGVILDTRDQEKVWKKCFEAKASADQKKKIAEKVKKTDQIESEWSKEGK